MRRLKNDIYVDLPLDPTLFEFNCEIKHEYAPRTNQY